MGRPQRTRPGDNAKAHILAAARHAATVRVASVVASWETPESPEAQLVHAGLEAQQRAKIHALLDGAAGASARVEGALGDLALWHQLEERNPELFGRMHHVYARYVP